MPAGTFSPPTPIAVTLQVVELVRQRQVQPVATYRLQLHAGFTLRDAAAIVPYLARLGISHVYCSPYLRAKAGSTHGYDLCDHSQINPELGGAAAYREFVAALRQHGMSHILDMVPNHMAASTQNPWWYDVLENGPNSPYAQFFDIDWHPVKPELADRILLPILGKQYGEALEEGQLQVEYRDGAFFLRYFDHDLPLGPKSAVPILSLRLTDLRSELGPEAAEFLELESIITSLDHLPPQTARDLASVRERQREKEVVKRRLRELTAASEPVRRHIERSVQIYNGTPNEPRSVDDLDQLLNQQAYRLSQWRAAFDEINYRRFFDINELAAISMEAPDVFWRSHILVRSLLTEGSLSGLRIDHIDGLFDPEQYLLRLQWAYLADLGQLAFQRLVAEARPAEPPGAGDEQAGAPAAEAAAFNAQAEWMRLAPEVLRLCCGQVSLPPPPAEEFRALFGPETVVEFPTGEPAAPLPPANFAGARPLFVLTEKILGPDEPLPESWPVAGTTGYDFLAVMNGLFVSPAGWDEIVKNYRRFTAHNATYEEVVQANKRLILRVAMSSELLMLAHGFNRVSEQHRRSRDLTLNMLRLAAREVLVSFPVYRVYPSRKGVSERDRRFVDFAVAMAKRQNPAFDPAVFDFVRNVLLLQHPDGLSANAIADREILAGKFQQVTSPVMAKGVEDTSFYVWFPLASVNEVGGDPRRPTTTVRQFHEQNQHRAVRYRQAMLATTTHDTKRSEDVRARLNVLSEIPGEWRNTVQRLTRINKRWRREVDGEAAPSLADEYLFYQSVLGVWPHQPPSADERKLLIERLQGYMEKAIHEAKQRTSWLNPSRAYDEAVREFVAKALREGHQNRFAAEIQALLGRIAAASQYNALSQVVLKLLSPGVPDIYQGQETWNYSLVDPDNRRPVDFAQLQATLADVTGEQPRETRAPEIHALDDPRLKLLVTHRLLGVRRRLAHLWMQGEYLPLEVTGALADHLLAFAWRAGQSQQIELVAAVPRFMQRFVAPQSMKGQSSLAEPPKCECVSPELWQGTAITLPAAAGVATSIFTGRIITLTEASLSARELFADFPVAIVELAS
jgi:(1->4)-alpha-D-glucan 1-alpha-D-glucosylmutase